MDFNTKKILDSEIEIYGTKQDVNTQKKALIIGLGGTGTDALLVVKDAIINRFNMNKNKIPSNIGLLAIDTDTKILDKRRGKAVIDENTEFLRLNDPNIRNNLHNKGNLPYYYTDWLNPNLAIPPGATPGTDGAGATRQIGRYLLMSNYKSVHDKIRAKLQNVMEAGEGGMVDVIILSGISGGTGSGTFIDMGYIVRKVCGSDLAIGELQKQITAYLFLPDVNKGNPDVPLKAYNYIEANGYAALKDLDYFMSIPDKKQVAASKNANRSYAFVQRYSDGIEDKVEMEEAPFDSTYLISGVPNVLSPQKDAYEYSINIVADSIVNFIGGSVNTGHIDDTESSGVAAVDINSAAMQATVTPFMVVEGGKQFRLIENYKYKVLGASAATLPMKDITDYIASEFLKKIAVLKAQSPVVKDFNDFYKTAGIDNIENNIFEKMGNPPEFITPEDLKNKKDSKDSREIFYNSLNKWQQSNISGVSTYVQQEIDKLENIIFNYINTVFLDIDKGPFFANKLMADPNNGIINKLQDVVNNIQNRENALRADVSRYQNDSNESYNKAQKARFGKNTLYQEFINYQRMSYEYSVRAKICEELIKSISGGGLKQNNNLINRIIEKNKNLFEVYTTILTALQQKFSSQDIVISSKKTDKIFIWDIVKLKNIKKDIDNILQKMDLDQKLNDLLMDMIANSEKWCNDNNTLNEFCDFISEKFSELTGQSMDDYLKNIDKKVLLNNINKLQKESNVHFPFNNKINAADMSNIYDRVTVPSNSPILIETIAEKIGKQPETSQLREKISWTKVNVGISICQYAYLQNFEVTYESIDPNNKQGIHLYENKGVRGINYPALLPKHYRDNGYINEREDKRIAEFESIYNKAKELKIIGINPNSVFIKVADDNFMNKKIKGIFHKYKIDEKSLEENNITLSRSNMYLCKKDLSNILEEEIPYNCFYFPNTAGYDSKNSDDETEYYAKIQFCKMPEAAVLAEKEIEKVENLKAIIDKIDNSISSFSYEKDIYMHFIYSLFFNIIHKSGIKYMYGEGDTKSELINIAKEPLFWRYHLFNCFKNDIYDIEKSNIEEKVNEVQESNDKIISLKQYCNDTLKSLAKEIMNVKSLENNEENLAKKNFYNKLNLFLCDEIEIYESMEF